MLTYLLPDSFISIIVYILIKNGSIWKGLIREFFLKFVTFPLGRKVENDKVHFLHHCFPKLGLIFGRDKFFYGKIVCYLLVEEFEENIWRNSSISDKYMTEITSVTNKVIKV